MRIRDRCCGFLGGGISSGWRRGVISVWEERRTTGGGLLDGVVWHVVGCSMFCWLSCLARAGLGYSLLGVVEKKWIGSRYKFKMQLSCEVGVWCWSGYAAQESDLFIKQASVMRCCRVVT